MMRGKKQKQKAKTKEKEKEKEKKREGLNSKERVDEEIMRTK